MFNRCRRIGWSEFIQASYTGLGTFVNTPLPYPPVGLFAPRFRIRLTGVRGRYIIYPSRKRGKEMGMPNDEKNIIAYKGLDKNFQCRGHQFEVGKAYENAGTIKRCENGFHSCENPLDVFAYYEPGISRYALVEASGPIDRGNNEDTKIASGRIHIKAEISMPDFVAAAIRWITAAANPTNKHHATGDQSASSATGDQSASSATGDRSASSATGYQSASSATGDRSASSATGDQSASSATGDRSASSATGKTPWP